MNLVLRATALVLVFSCALTLPAQQAPAPPAPPTPPLVKRPANTSPSTPALSSPAPAPAEPLVTPPPQPEAAHVLPAGVPLRVQIDHRYPLKTGARLQGHLIAPVYLVDHEVLPVNTPVFGSITAKQPVSSAMRTDALLNGDFTPLARPILRFDQIQLPDGSRAPIDTRVTERTADVIHMASAGAKRPSIKDQVMGQVKQRRQDTLDTFTKPGKADRLRRMLYAQLPYHPQEIWAGTQYDADLLSPLPLSAPAPPSLPLADLGNKRPAGRIEARLVDGISSATGKRSQAIEAVLSKPLLDPARRQVLLPEGTRLKGVVVEAQPARWMARNGKLRFSFRSIELPPGSTTGPGSAPTERAVLGQLSAAEGMQGENLSIDSEGGAKAGSGKNKFLAPLALGVMAMASMDDDGNLAAKGAVTSNGFGLVARVVGLAAANARVSAGFAYFALGKSVYKRWIARGHEVEFPRDTRLEIDLENR